MKCSIFATNKGGAESAWSRSGHDSLRDEQLDAGNADDFRRDLSPVLQDCHKLVLDLSRVQFVDSRGCGAIIGCLKQVSAAGGDLKLCQVTRAVRTVFELIRLHRICEIFN